MSAALQLPANLYSSLRRRGGLPARYISGLHAKQSKFVRDKSKRKSALTGRRGGKSHAIGVWLVEGAESAPGKKSLFVALTRGKAKSILWDDCLAQLSQQYALGLRLKHDEGQLYISFPNGHRIWLIGVDNRSEIEKIRGERLFRVVIDEAQAFGDYLKQLVEDAIEPALMDYDGELALTGTPSAYAAGFFWAITTGQDPDTPAWPTHHWTSLDNKFLLNSEQWLSDKRERSHWDENHPTYRREYLGEWTDDIGSLVYPLGANNFWQPAALGPFGLPPGEYVFGLGVDLGFSEFSTAFVLAACRKGTGQIYILQAYTRSRLIPTALATHVEQVRERVKKEATASLRVVVDEGALGKGYAEQMRVLGVACEPAQKSEKRAYQELVAGLIKSGKAPEEDAHGNWLGGAGLLMNFTACRDLVEEARKLQFDPETGFEDARYPNHCCDAMLYIVRALMPIYAPEHEQPKPGSAELANLEMRKHKEKLVKERERKARGIFG